jgi:riboflavin kinase/FMN adenylyltransferase
MKLTGKIIHGEGRGQHMGLPTINLAEHPSDLEEGVYAVWVESKFGRNKGAMNWGARPTFDELESVMEVHLLDFDGDLYDQEVEVEVVKKIREIQKFDSKESLMIQIKKDIAEISALLVY